MKFLLVSPFSSVSGSAVRFLHIAKHLSMLGHEVVYVERRHKEEPKPQISGVKYLSSPIMPNLFLDIFISTIYNTFVLFIHRNCDIYYALKPAPNNGLPALLARAAGKRIFVDIDDLDYGYFPPGLKRAVARFFFDSLPKRFHLVTCHTEKLRLYIIETIGVPEKKVYYLAQGVSDIFLDYKPTSKPTPYSIVYVATLGLTSDFDDLLEPLADLCRREPRCTINIVGDGVKRERFQQRVRELDVEKQFVFHGRVPHEKLPELISRCQIGVNYMRPGLTNDCRAILKIREYLALGLQVVCNSTGDAKLFSEFISIEDTPIGIARKLLRLLHSTKTAISSDGREFIESRLRWNAIMSIFCNRIQPSVVSI